MRDSRHVRPRDAVAGGADGCGSVVLHSRFHRQENESENFGTRHLPIHSWHAWNAADALREDGVGHRGACRRGREHRCRGTRNPRACPCPPSRRPSPPSTFSRARSPNERQHPSQKRVTIQTASHEIEAYELSLEITRRVLLFYPSFNLVVSFRVAAVAPSLRN